MQSNKYDIIVVGAGNAGLCAAATAAKAGKKLLLLEKNPLPGGCATSFCRGRFEFEPSLHELASVGTEDKPGSVRKLFESFGAEIGWVNESNAFRAIVKDGYDVTMPTGVEAFCDELERLVPGCRESVEKVFMSAKKVDAAIAYMSKGKPDNAVLMQEHADFLHMASHSVDSCLDELGVPKKAADIIKTYWSYLGASTNELDFAHYAVMLSRYIDGSPAMPEMKSHELSLALDKAIRDMGGEIRYNTKVISFISKDGRVVGVRAGDTEFYADAVICNLFPDTVLEKMLDEEVTSAPALKLANARETGKLFFTVYLGLDRSCEELGIKDYSVFLFNTNDTVKQYEDCNDPPKGLVIVNCLNTVIPNSSPKGTSTLFFTTMMTEDAWGQVEPKDYKKLKNRIASEMIERYEEAMGIEIKPYIEEITVATPATFARYLGTPNGTPYGYEIKGGDTMITRIVHKSKENFIPGLYFVGAHGERADGYSSTYAQGSSTAKSVIGRMKNEG